MESEEANGRFHARQACADETDVDFDDRPEQHLFHLPCVIRAGEIDVHQIDQADDRDDADEAAEHENASEHEPLSNRNAQSPDVSQRHDEKKDVRDDVGDRSTL